MIKRVIFDVILFISIFVFPWWVNVFFMLIGVFYFRNFYEFILVGVIIYSLYSIPGDKLISSPVVFSFAVVILYSIIQYIQSNIILYKV
jgi:hypothetical protein